MKRDQHSATSARIFGVSVVAGLIALLGCGTSPTAPVVTDEPREIAVVPIAPDYGIHDTYVRDGLAFVAAWNSGLIIFDVGNGMAGGSPAAPVEVGRLITNDNGVPGGPAVHNSWWFHDPSTGARRYLFVGQEGPAAIGASSSGDIHVLDVSDLANPIEVAWLRIPDAGTHNFWMDETAGVLYAAYYNAGVVAVDVSGVLQGDLAARVIAQRPVGGPDSTFTWGVQLAGGSLWASDMISGLFKLDPATLQTVGGGSNLPNRWGSDLWVHGAHAYTGTWGAVARNGVVGDVLNIWRIDGAGPVLADSLRIADIRTISDVEVSEDGGFLIATAERGTGAGLHLFDLADPEAPRAVTHVPVAEGLHTGTVARIDGRFYVFAARNPPMPALMIYDVSP